MEKKKRLNFGNMENEPMRRIGIQNYIVVIVIFLLTIGVVWGLRNWYISYQKYQLTIPVLKGTLKEIAVNEIDNYITENDDAIIYFEVSNEEESRKVSKGLIDIVKEKNLTDRVVYLNLASLTDKDSFLKEFSSKYIEKEINYPSIVVFNDGKASLVATKTQNKKLRASDIAQLFDEHEIEGE